MKKGIIYCRVSTVGQAEEGVSLDNQLHKCKQFLELHDYEVTKIFREEGKSGKTEWRDEFQNMMNYIRENKGKIDSVCFYSLSRLGRNVQLILETIEELNEYDITVLSVNEKLDTSNPMGRFVLTILSALAQLESEQTAERVFDAMLYSSRENGTWQGARYYPYGYVPSKEKDSRGNNPLVIVPEQAEQVKLIFDYYTKGLDGDTNVGTFKIAKKLNQLGYKYLREGARSKEWTNKRVLDIIRNAHFYAGWYYWNRTGTREKVIIEKTEFGTTRKKVMSNRSKSLKPVMETYIKPKSEWAISKGQHEPIILETTWKAAEAKYESRRNTNPNLDTTRQPKHYLTGILTCPDCGGRMIASTSSRMTKKNGKVLDVYYRCQKASSGENCRHNVIKEDYVLPVVKQAFLSYYPLLIKRKIDNILINKLYNDENLKSKEDEEILSIKNQIDVLLSKIESFYNDYVEGLLLRDNYIRIKEKNETEIKLLEEKIEQIKAKKEEFIINKETFNELKNIIYNFSNAEEYFNSLDKLAQRDLLNEVVVKVEVIKKQGLKGNKSIQIKRVIINDEITHMNHRIFDIMKDKDLAEKFLHLNAEIKNNAKMKDIKSFITLRPPKSVYDFENEYNVVYYYPETDLYNINYTLQNKIEEIEEREEVIKLLEEENEKNEGIFEELINRVQAGEL